MSFRTVMITENAYLSYKNGYLQIRRSDDLKQIHITEIDNLLIDSTMTSISSYLLCELIKSKVKIIFCDEKRNPYGELIPYYASYNNSKKINIQIKWDEDTKKNVWQEIIRYKIINQAQILLNFEKDGYDKLIEYSLSIEEDDKTNREGHAAKVYFNSLFGKGFSRNQENDINAALNYGYSIILSSINKEIVNNGYLTQIGIKHKNEFNNYNLSCDFMEPFRPLIDKYVYNNKDREFNSKYKQEIVNLLNERYIYNNKQFYLSDIIKFFTRNILECLEKNNLSNLKGFNIYEEQIYEDIDII